MDLAISISEAESNELKAKILYNVEKKITDELIDAMRRTIQREVTTHMRAKAKEKLYELLAAAFTIEKIEAILTQELTSLQTPQYADEETFIKKELRNAIFRVTQTYGESISSELKNLLYMALTYGFHQKEMPQK